MDIKLIFIVEQVGEAGSILDVMSAMMENISTITVVARATFASV